MGCLVTENGYIEHITLPEEREEAIAMIRRLIEHSSVIQTVYDRLDFEFCYFFVAVPSTYRTGYTPQRNDVLSQLTRLSVYGRGIVLSREESIRYGRMIF